MTDNSRHEDAAPSSLPGLLAALASGARAVHGLPLDDDFSYEKSFPEFSKALGETQEVMLQTLSLALQQTSANQDIDDILETESFRNIEDPLLWDACADACEALVDEVERFLKSPAGLEDENITGTLTNLAGMARHKAKSTLGRLVETTVDMEKPQVTYGIDTSKLNDRTEPFVPDVHPDKPFSVTPLDLSLHPGHGLETRYEPLRSNVQVSNSVIAPSEHVLHPYETEIKSFEFRPWQLKASKPEGDILIPSSLEATWVDTVPELEKLSQTLESVQEVAIDLEHHSYRSFAGLLCLMQISIRGIKGEMHNYLIDVFPLWKHINPLLAPMFANPDIVKVMHGADSDVQWLQRDFGIYIVNLFDTGRAARALGLSSASLAFALSKYAGVQADKTHQLSDWRQRPLPDAMRQYAISDTHYLLDICDRMKWDLKKHKEASIEDVLDTSKKICLIRYAKEPFNPEGFRSLTKQRASGRQKTELNSRQEQVLEKLWDWRDQTARSCDDSPAYVCSNAVLLRISLSCPTTVTGLQTLLNPIPPLVLQFATAVTQIVRKVRTHTNLQEVAVEHDAKEGKSQKLQQRQPAVGAPSSAFFKPAERGPDDSVRRSGMLSPVLGTEALYKQAGWVTPLGGTPEDNEARRSMMRRLVEEQGLEPLATTTEEEGDSDALADSEGATTPAKPRSLLTVNRGNKDYRAQQFSNHSLRMGKEGSSSNSGQSRARTADGIGPARAARGHSQSPARGSAVEEEIKKAQQSASFIRDGISQKEEMLGLISSGTDMDEEDLDVDDVPQKSGGTAGSEVKGNDNVSDNEEEFVIPRSMREIYKISNRNRRNKKVASPTPDRASLPTNQKEMEYLAKAETLLKDRGLEGKGYFDEGGKSTSPGGSIKRQRTKSTGTEQDDAGGSGSRDNSFKISREDDVAYMHEIGWIPSKEEADKLLGQDGAASGEYDDDATAGSSTKGGRDTKTPTFDYSSIGAIGAFNPQAQSGATVANPFFAGAAMAGGPLTQQGNATKADRKKNNFSGGKGGKQNRRQQQQERPEKRDGKTHAYRKR